MNRTVIHGISSRSSQALVVVPVDIQAALECRLLRTAYCEVPPNIFYLCNGFSNGGYQVTRHVS